MQDPGDDVNNIDDAPSETDPSTIGLYLTAACSGTSLAQKPNFGYLCGMSWVLLGADGSPLGTSQRVLWKTTVFWGEISELVTSPSQCCDVPQNCTCIIAQGNQGDSEIRSWTLLTPSDWPFKCR